MVPPTFEQLARMSDDRLDVALGAALISRDVHGNLDAGVVVATLDELASPLTATLGDRPLREQAAAVADHVYVRLGFRGNESDYYDPRNSLLSDVLERRLGIPITLAVVYCEIARRAGVLARGVAFPGHFLVRLDSRREPREAPVFVDPFFGGRVLDDDGLRQLYRRVTGREDAVSSDLLEPASPRTVLHRMLVNLRAIYLSRGDMARAMLTIDRILCLTPDAAEPLRERGLLSARLGATQAALADLERFLVVAPTSSEAPQIRARIAELRERAKTRALN